MIHNLEEYTNSFDEPDVFETSDVEEITIPTVSEENPDIDTTSLPHGVEVFENFIVDTTNTDYSDRVDALAAKSYQVFRVDETVPQKLARLKRELEGINLQRQRERLGDVTDAQVDEVAKMLDEALQANTQAHFVKFYQNAKSACVVERELELAVNPQMLELESRVAKVEQSIGVDDFNTVVGQLDYLKKQLKLVDPELIGFFAEKLSELTAKYEVSSLARKVNQNEAIKGDVIKSLTPEGDKIGAMYQLCKSLDKYVSLVPSILNHLETLNGLHRELDHVAAVSTRFHDTLTVLEQQADSWEETLRVMEQKLDLQAQLLNAKKG